MKNIQYKIEYIKTHTTTDYQFINNFNGSLRKAAEQLGFDVKTELLDRLGIKIFYTSDGSKKLTIWFN